MLRMSKLEGHIEFASRIHLLHRQQSRRLASALGEAAPCGEGTVSQKLRGRQQGTTSANPPGLIRRYDMNSAIRIQDNGVSSASSNTLGSYAQQETLQGM